MASAWGKSWAGAWLNSWGTIAQDADTGGGNHGSSRLRRRKIYADWARERQRAEREPVIAGEEEEKKPVEVIEWELLRAQELEILAKIETLETMRKAGELAEAEFEKQMVQEQEALSSLFMALELDRKIFLTFMG